MTSSSLCLLFRSLLLGVLILSLGCTASRRGGGGGGGGDDDDDSAADDDDDLFNPDDDDDASDDDDVSDDDDTSSDDDDTSADDDDTSADDDDTSVDDDDTSADDDDSTSAPDWDSDGWDNTQDCNDYDASVYPGATELCDGLDNDCDGSAEADEFDWDNDGVRPCEGDCDDSDSEIYPWAFEQCDGVDNDCNGSLGSDEQDYDFDGYMGCEGDCDDYDYQVHPGASEICEDFIDQDCDGADLPCSTGSCEFGTEVDFGGRCYYLDGSGGTCEFGYQLAPQSILNSIATSFIGKDYKNQESDNCCVWHANQATENQDWGMDAECNASGPFTEGPVLGGAGCSDALNTNPGQLTLCQSN